MDREAAEYSKIKAVITALISRMSVLEQNYITLANQQPQFTTLMNRVELLEKQIYDCTSDITSITDRVNIVKTKMDEKVTDNQVSFLQSLHSTDSKQAELPKRKLASSSDEPSKKRRNTGRHVYEDFKPVDAPENDTLDRKPKEEVKNDLTQIDTLSNHSCSQCDHKAASKRMLEDHIKKNHADTETLYCAKCSYNSVVKQELIEHFRSVHKKPTAAEAGRKERESKIKESEDANNVASTENNSDENDYSTQHACSQCKHQATSKRALEDHIKKTHSEEETLYCAKCSYNSVIKQELIDHFRSVHKKPKENQ